MELRLRIIREAYQAYSGSVYNLGFLFIALGYLIVKNRKKAHAILGYVILGMVMLATPVLANRLLTVGSDYGNHWMLYAVLCAAVVIAYAGADALAETKEKREKWLVAICFAVALQFGTGFMYTADNFMLPGNVAKVSQETVGIAEALTNVQNAVVIAPEEVAVQLKKYDKNIKIIYGSDVSYDSTDLETFMQSATNYNCNCIVVESGIDNEAIVHASGYQILAVTENYRVYTRK